MTSLISGLVYAYLLFTAIHTWLISNISFRNYHSNLHLHHIYMGIWHKHFFRNVHKSINDTQYFPQEAKFPILDTLRKIWLPSHSTGDLFKYIFFSKTCYVSYKIAFFRKGPIGNKSFGWDNGLAQNKGQTIAWNNDARSLTQMYQHLTDYIFKCIIM